MITTRFSKEELDWLNSLPRYNNWVFGANVWCRVEPPAVRPYCGCDNVWFMYQTNGPSYWQHGEVLFAADEDCSEALREWMLKCHVSQ